MYGCRAILAPATFAARRPPAAFLAAVCVGRCGMVAPVLRMTVEVHQAGGTLRRLRPLRAERGAAF